MDERRKKYPFNGPQISLGLGSFIIGLEIIFWWVGILLPGTCYAQEHYSYYEIVIPKKLVTFKSKEQSIEKLSYMLLMRGKRQVIQLRLKRGLFLKDFPVYTYTQEALDVNAPFIQDDCFYDGYIEGELRSLVSVSTCWGLRGMIAVEEFVYGIEPIGTSKDFEHVLYYMDGHVRGSCKVSGENAPKSTVGLHPIGNEDYSHGKEEPVNYIWSHTKYLELFVVVDNRRFLMWNSNVTKTVRSVTDALAHVNTYSRAIRLGVVLVGLEIWSERDRVKVSGDLGEVLRTFNHWREGELVLRARHDVAHLIVGYDPGERAGEAFLGGACAPGRAAGVEAFPHEDPVAFAALLAHELGHNLGMRHDHPNCLCPKRPSCLMGLPVSLRGGFSNCSLGDFYDFVYAPHGSCLYNKPVAGPLPRKPRCGDGVLDAGEECDCGDGDHGDCLEAACCLPSCQRRPGSDCASGPCCSKCRLVKAATPCRPSVDECDLPEFCSGVTPHCQPDSYQQDGAPCRGEGRCYRGRCQSLRGQCEALFGAGSRAARPSCYRLLNTRGDRFGNCGGGQPGLSKAFVACEPQHVLCGKLLCEHVSRLPRMRKHHTLLQIPLGDAWCWAADLFEDVAVPEGGAVQAGTWCGPRQVCVNRTCSEAPLAECEPQSTCHGRGVCNNLEHCHCDAGYAPPACEAEGPGGSVDSGPSMESSIVSLAVRVPMSTTNPPPTPAGRLVAPGAVTPGAKPDIYEEGSESAPPSLSPTSESPLPVGTSAPECPNKYKKIPAIVVVISALIVNIILLMSLLAIVFVLFFSQRIPWPIADENRTEICEASEKVNPPPHP